MKLVSRQEFVSAARAEIGTPFVHQGRVSRAGVDCSGLLVVAAKACGIVLKNDRTDYPRVPRPTEFHDVMKKGMEGQEILVGEARLGDVLEFWLLDRGSRPRFPQHVAILTEIAPDPMIVHSYANRNKVVEHRLSAVFMKMRWHDMITAAYHCPGVDWDGPSELLGDYCESLPEARVWPP